MQVPSTQQGRGETRAYLGLVAAFMLLIVSIGVEAASGELLLPLLGAFASGVCALLSIRAMYRATRS